MHTKYSDASYIEKTAGKDRLVTSRNDMLDCCHKAASNTGREGNFRCPTCGNDIYVGDSQ